MSLLCYRRFWHVCSFSQWQRLLLGNEPYGRGADPPRSADGVAQQGQGLAADNGSRRRGKGAGRIAARATSTRHSSPTATSGTARPCLCRAIWGGWRIFLIMACPEMCRTQTRTRPCTLRVRAPAHVIWRFVRMCVCVCMCLCVCACARTHACSCHLTTRVAGRHHMSTLRATMTGDPLDV